MTAFLLIGGAVLLVAGVIALLLRRRWLAATPAPGRDAAACAPFDSGAGTSSRRPHHEHQTTP